VCGIGIFGLGLTTALGYSVFHFQPFADGSAWLDFWDFIVSTNLLPIGAMIFAIFCTTKIGWGWDAFKKEANAGKGLKVHDWMQPLFNILPGIILALYIYGLITFGW
ncbi:MAG: sodium-dependent transporter, partial [Clostridia bacterium]|nr:sodium-dependent transporter [Clostridia bacterium]